MDFSSVLRLRPLGDFGVEVVFVGSDSFGFEVAGVVASLGLRPLLAGGGVSSSLCFLLPENCKLQLDEKKHSIQETEANLPVGDSASGCLVGVLAGGGVMVHRRLELRSKPSVDQ